MHSFSKAIVIVGLLAPGSGQTLGLGDIKLHSFLNQPVDAEVPLVLSGEQLDQIRIGLAAPAEFAKVGLTRAPAIGKLRFDAVQRRDGSFAVRIRSLDVISEPFLSFLMEVTWPQGRMLRSFTVLLDPPDALAMPVTMARQDLTAGPRDRGRRPNPGLATARIPESSASLQSDRPGRYGPVGRNEKLWKIAERLKPDASIPTERMMMALFRLNPRAFSRPSVNALNAGTYLRVPGRDDLLGLGDTAPSTAEPSLQAERPNRPAQHRVAALPRATNVGAGSAQPNLDGPETLTAAASSPARPTENPAWPAIEKLRRENEQIRIRMTQLELRVIDLTRQLEARAHGAGVPQQAAPATVPAATTEPVVAALPTTHTAPGTLASRDVEAGSQPVEATEPATGIASVPATAPAQTPAGESTRPGTDPDSAGSKPKPAATAGLSHSAATPPRGAAAPAADDSLLPWLTGLAAALAAALLAGYARRRGEARRSPTVAHEDALTTASKATARTAPAGLINAAVTEPLNAADARPDVEKVQLAPECSPAEPSDGDALFEADIYLAYGKFRQAEESIQRAIDLAPERPEPYLKLLHVYAASQNRNAFQTLTESLKTERPIADPEFWARANALAQTIGLPAKTLEGSPSKPAKDNIPPNAEPDETDQLIAKLKRFSLENRSPDEETAGAALDDAIQSSGDVPYLGPTNVGAPDSVQSDDDSGETPTASASGTGEPAEDTHVIPYDPAPFSEQATDGAVDAALDTDAARSIEDLLKELSAMHFEEHLATAPDDSSTAATDRSLAAQTDEQTYHAVAEIEDLESKLDLARAYADMQDAVQARHILNEVISGGTAEQRREAQALLGRLG